MDVYHGIGARVTNDMFKAIVALADDYKNGKVDRADMMLTVADNGTQKNGTELSVKQRKGTNYV